MKIRFSITLDEELVKKIDKKRGDVPRSKYINNNLLLLVKGGLRKNEN